MSRLTILDENEPEDYRNLRLMGGVTVSRKLRQAALIGLTLAFSPAVSRGYDGPAISLQAMHGLQQPGMQVLGASWRLRERPSADGARWQHHLMPEVHAQYWQADAGAGHGRRGTPAIGALAVLRAMPPVCERCFIDLGVGMFALLQRQALEPRRTGSAVVFTEQFAVGLYLDAARRIEARAGYAHYSNAGLRRPNPGYDFLLLGLVAHY